MLLEAMDCVLTSITLKADTIGSRYSWSLGRCVQLISTEMHQALRFVSRRLGWNAVTPELVKAFQRQAPKGVPRYLSHRDNSESKVDGLSRGMYLLDDRTAVPVEKLSWINDPFGNFPSVSRFLFQVLYDVKELTDDYYATGKSEYFNGAKALARRWISECLYTERWAHVWDDHHTAIRAIILCQLWAAARGNEPLGSAFMSELFSAIVRHAEKLAHESFYRRDHNHGVTQAYALLAIGLLFPLHPKGTTWANLGRLRLEEQMVKNVSPEGVHLEHTPLYHFYVFDQFNGAYQLAQAHGMTFSDGFHQRLQAMLGSGAHLLKPNGTPTAMGDSNRDSAVRIEEEALKGYSTESVGNYLYSRTKGKKGITPKNTSVLLAGAGYACLRSGWGESENFTDERYLIFRTATFKTAHIHLDVFSFELYAYGDDLIIDSGGPYAYGDPMRRDYFVSTAAHNTVVVDRRNQEVGESRILRRQSTSDYDLLDAEHHNYPGVTHRRAIVFVRPDYFIILDRLEADSPRRYSQLFHVNPNLTVEFHGLTATTLNPSGGPTVQIIPLLVEGLTVGLHRASLTPNQGWVCLGDHRMVPSPVIDYQRSATSTAFAVLVVPEAPGHSRPAWGKIDGLIFQGETQFHVGIGDRKNEIVISPDGEIAIKRE